MTLKESYKARYDNVLVPLALRLQSELSEWLASEPRIDRISARPKSVERFLAKAAKKENGQPKYDDPLNQIQDQIGARIIVFYQTDVARIEQSIRNYLRPIEFKMMLPESQWSFGYFGRHFIFLFPTHMADDPQLDQSMVPICFELQIKTLFQHAWSEANHDLGYKPGENELDQDDERSLAFTSAQAWGADKIFSELFQKTQGR